MKVFVEDIKEDYARLKKSAKKASEKTQEELEEEARIMFLASKLPSEEDAPGENK